MANAKSSSVVTITQSVGSDDDDTVVVDLTGLRSCVTGNPMYVCTENRDAHSSPRYNNNNNNNNVIVAIIDSCLEVTDVDALHDMVLSLKQERDRQRRVYSARRSGAEINLSKLLGARESGLRIAIRDVQFAEFSEYKQQAEAAAEHHLSKLILTMVPVDLRAVFIDSDIGSVYLNYCAKYGDVLRRITVCQRTHDDWTHAMHGVTTAHTGRVEPHAHVLTFQAVDNPIYVPREMSIANYLTRLTVTRVEITGPSRHRLRKELAHMHTQRDDVPELEQLESHVEEVLKSPLKVCQALERACVNAQRSLQLPMVVWTESVSHRKHELKNYASAAGRDHTYRVAVVRMFTFQEPRQDIARWFHDRLLKEKFSFQQLAAEQCGEQTKRLLRLMNMQRDTVVRHVCAHIGETLSCCRVKMKEERVQRLLKVVTSRTSSEKSIRVLCNCTGIPTNPRESAYALAFKPQTLYRLQRAPGEAYAHDLAVPWLWQGTDMDCQKLTSRLQVTVQPVATMTTTALHPSSQSQS